MEISIKFGPGSTSEFVRKARALAWGFLWACIGGMGPAGMALWWDLTTYQDYGIDWKHVLQLAASGAAPGAAGYYFKHRAEVKALLHIPDDVMKELEEARLITGQFKVPKEEK